MSETGQLEERSDELHGSWDREIQLFPMPGGSITVTGPVWNMIGRRGFDPRTFTLAAADTHLKHQ